MAFEKLTEDQYYNLPINEAETMYNLQNPDQEFLDFIRRQPQNLGFVPTNVAQNPAMVNYGITSLPEFDMANLPMYEKDDEQSQEYIDQVKKSQGGGIGGLFKFLLGLAVPGAGFLMNMGGKSLEGIKSLNQRLQQSDFGQATSLMDYFDMRKYGGAQGRRDAAARNMAQARGITKSLASRPSSTSGGYQQGPGGSGAQATGASKSKSQAGPGFSGSGSAAEMGSF